MYNPYYDAEEKEVEMMCQTLNKYYMEKIIHPYRNSEKIIDLHTHTNYSDGELSPSSPSVSFFLTIF